MPASGTVKSLQGQYAAANRWRKPEAESIARDLAAARIQDYIKRVVDAAPPLTSEQRDRLAGLLRGAA